MTTIPKSLVKHHCKSRSLVKIARESIDPNDLNGFIVDYNDQWILLKREYDFYIDGWVLIRIEDISSIQSTPTCIFQKALLEEEGKLDQIDFSVKLPEGGVRGFLEDFDRHSVIIIEDESQDDLFLIGFIDGVTEEAVSLDFFSGVGHIDGEKSVLALESITSISYETNYCLHYQRYFERNQNN